MNIIAEASRLSNGDYGAIIIYLLVVIGMGFWFSRKENTSEDFLLGGRRIPWLAIGVSYMMSLFSTYSLVMVPGEIYNHSISLFLPNLIAPLLSIGAFFIFVRFYFKLQSFTPFEYLERRYDKGIRLLVSLLYLYGKLIYLGMVLFATSKVFEGGAGWPAWQTILCVGVIGIFYTVMGGMKAVVWTDVAQFFVLAAGMIITVWVCCSKQNSGPMEIISYAFQHGRGPVQFTEPSFYTFNPYVRLCFWFLIIGQIMGALSGSSSDQVSIQRLLSTNSYNSAKKAMYTNAILTIPFMLILLFIGLAIFSFYNQNPDPRVTSGDTAFFTFVATQLPTPFPGLILAAMLAAVMSTLDSGMNSLSGIYLKEIHQKYFNKAIPEIKQVRLLRISTVIIGVFAMSLSLLICYTAASLKQSIVEASTIFAALSAITLPAYIFAVTSKKVDSFIIWMLAALTWGINFAMISWYYRTHSELEAPIATTWWAIPLFSGLIMLGLWAGVRKIIPRGSFAVLFISVLNFGYFIGALLWYIVGQINGGGKLSFAWVGIPTCLLVYTLGYLWIKFFGKEQPAYKHMGLTLWSFNQKLRDEPNE